MHNMKKIYVSALLACLVAFSGQAQQQKQTQQQKKENLNKEITLQKDFVPVEKKATKKNSLPKVKKTSSTKAVNLKYSDWAAPIDVPSEVPTMLPYGYRTAHIFSDQRGYLSFGAGSQLNMTGNAGYRIVDTETNKLGVWYQHNSTWGGKNTSESITDDALRMKQKYNDNTFGINFKNTATSGVLNLDLLGHFDSFNYYGAQSDFYDNHKQSFTNFGVNIGWDGQSRLNGHRFDYKIGFGYGYAGYGKAFADTLTDYKGAKEHSLKFDLGGRYYTGDESSFGINATFDYVNKKADSDMLNALMLPTDSINKSYGMVTLNPYYSFLGEAVRAQLGANVQFSFSDGTAVRIAPNVKLDFRLADGAYLYADLQGGKTLNKLARVAALNRYSDPLGMYQNTFTPVDGEVGFKLGEFDGFSAKAFVGYGLVRRDLVTYVTADALGNPDMSNFSYTKYQYFDSKGLKAGAELGYKYRSIIDLNGKVTYAPQKDEVNVDGDNDIKGYSLGLDRPQYVANVDLKVTPIKPLAIELGWEFRGKRSTVLASDNGFSLLKLNDANNLHLGARYRITDVITIWAQGNNLLNRKWDYLYGMGAQKLCIMGGFGLVF